MRDGGPVRLRGRRRECAALGELASRVTAGHGAVLVLRGDAGIGKTALLDHLAARVAEHRVIRVAAAESETELPFAGLHQVCAPFLDRLGTLPPPRAQALATVFGLGPGPPSDRLLVGPAVRGLLSGAAAGQPLFCLVDDAQWLDPASARTLASVARRMDDAPLALVLASRERRGQDEWTGLPELRLDGLDDADARALLDAAADGPADERIRDRILAEARGNPLALLELPCGLARTGPGDGPAPAVPRPVTDRAEQGRLTRVRSLPAATRRLLLLAAAEPVGDAALLVRAAELLGIGADAARPAAGLLVLGTPVRFRHPLLRCALYRSAGPAELREVHRVLAEATDRETDPDRRAWHLARAAVGPDEAVAAELESSAGRAQARGDITTAASYLARAAVLTPRPDHRATRALAAARTQLRAGAPAAARDLLALAGNGTLDALGRARMDLLRARTAFASGRGDEALDLLLTTARGLGPLDGGLARDAFLDALTAAMRAGHLAPGTPVREVAAAARRTLPPVTRPPRTADLLLDALVVRFTAGHGEAVAAAREAVRAVCRETDPEEILRLSWPAAALAADTWDEEGWTELVTRQVRTARTAGAPAELSLALDSRVVLHTCAGEPEAAARLLAELARLRAVAGTDPVPYGAMTLAAWHGRAPEAVPLIEAGTDEAAHRGEGLGVAVGLRASAVLHNGLGGYEEAFDAARRATTHRQDLIAADRGLPELVEAAARSGRCDVAEAALEPLVRVTDAAATDWALGVQARARALLSRGRAAEGLYREALERLERTRLEGESARAHLLYGEWLRRENRRTDARTHLREAHARFVRRGAEAFAERAGRELRATGETVARRDGGAAEALTAQENQIARLARDGLTNPEIGARLFLSPHTVEWHLRKVYAKLGIASRRQLHTVL
jgi:DNA-binding CsgD family transcriptional regulator